MTTTTLPLLDVGDARVVVPAPDAGPGNWSGAASAFQDGDVTYLAYRVRRPIIEGRGVSTVVSRSRDGLVFEPVCEVDRDAFGAESFERPVVLRTPDRRLAALPVLCHARLQALVDRGPRRRPSRGPAPRPPDRGAGGRRPGRRQGPGDPGRRRRRLARLDLRAPPDRHGARGPDVDRLRHQHRWPAVGAGRHRAVAPPRRVGRAWRPGHHRRLRSTHWSSCTTADRPPPTTGTSAPVSREARWRHPLEPLVPDPEAGVIASPHSDGALRYVTQVTLSDGTVRRYAEMARPDGAHDLVLL